VIWGWCVAVVFVGSIWGTGKGEDSRGTGVR